MRTAYFDPGKATGFALIDLTLGTLAGSDDVVEDIYVVDQAEMSIEEVYSWALCQISHCTTDRIVCESFIISVETGKKTQAPWSLEIIGILRFIADTFNMPFQLQTAASAKAFCSNDRLREFDMWFVGSDHVRDAMRHAILDISKMRGGYEALVLRGD